MILQAIGAGCVYGLSVMDATGLPSGTVYPALRRLEKAGLIRSSWESQRIADAEQRPARKYYRLTQGGRDRLEVAQKRYPLLAGLLAGPKGR
jgi:DNA-binding PadR family transcriptional regulator